jgi:hypothetical protein
LDHRQYGINIVFASVEKINQIGKAFTRVRRPVVLKDQSLDVFDRRLAVEAHEKLADMSCR